jgi:integrase
MATAQSTKYRGKIIRARATAWQVDFGTRQGQRLQRSFKTKADAKLAIDEQADQKNLEHIDQKNRRVAVFDLPDKQRIDVISALEKLDGSATLTEAVEFYLGHTSPPGGARTVNSVLTEYIEAKKRANRRQRTIQDIQTRLGRFAKDHGETSLHELTTSDLEKWLNKHDYQQISRLNYRTALTGFFNFAVKRGYAQANPAQGIERPTLDEKIPEILTVEECRELLASAEEHRPKMAPYFAICLFAGLRPAEAAGVDWKHINLSARTITVRPEVAKKRRQRIIDISDNLLAWLTRYRQTSGRLYYMRKEFEKVRSKAEGVTWANDIMRHSYGSYHLAQHQDAARTALQMGHMSTDILFNHYRELVTKKETEEYWTTAPSAKSQSLRLAV